jgi:hypothetical protein
MINSSAILLSSLPFLKEIRFDNQSRLTDITRKNS